MYSKSRYRGLMFKIIITSGVVRGSYYFSLTFSLVLVGIFVGLRILDLEIKCKNISYILCKYGQIFLYFDQFLRLVTIIFNF